MGGLEYRARVVLHNADGFHARPAAALAALARRYRGAALRVRKGTAEADARSVLELMTLGAGRGDEVDLVATGPAAEALLEAAVRLVGQGFGPGASDG